MLRSNGKIATTCLAMASILAGCGGLSTTKHSGSQPDNGYVIYAPMVVFNVSATLVCMTPDKDGKCAKDKQEEKCVIGAPYYLPDYENRYVVKFTSGLGSYSSQVAIQDGWMLAGATSTANPAEFVTAVAEFSVAGGARNCPVGIYKFEPNGRTFEKLTTPF